MVSEVVVMVATNTKNKLSYSLRTTIVGTVMARRN
jgi:hypothetical protein